jgi:hypothetical protein
VCAGILREDLLKLEVKQAAREDVFGDIVRVHFEHRPETNAGELTRVWVEDRYVVAVARGTNSTEKTNTIWIDSALRSRLRVKENTKYDFRFQKADFWDELYWALNTTEPVPRIAARLAVLSAILGAFGLALGAVSLWLAMRTL